MKNKLLPVIIVCILVTIAGCGRPGPGPYYLHMDNLEVTSQNGSYLLNASVYLSGGDLTLRGVEVRAIKSGRVTRRQTLGELNNTIFRKDVNISTENRPDKIIVVYDEALNEGERNARVRGFKYVGGEYEPFSDYSPEY